MTISTKKFVLILVNIFFLLFAFFEIFALILLNQDWTGVFTSQYNLTSDKSALLFLSPVFLVIYILVFIFLIAKEFKIKKITTKMIINVVADIILFLFIGFNVMWFVLIMEKNSFAFN